MQGKNMMFLYVAKGVCLDPSWIFSNWLTGLVVHDGCLNSKKGLKQSKIDPFLVGTAR
jgi:hypothetical protein